MKLIAFFVKFVLSSKIKLVLTKNITGNTEKPLTLRALKQPSIEAKMKNSKPHARIFGSAEPRRGLKIKIS